MPDTREKLIEILEQAGTMRQFPGSLANILIENGVVISNSETTTVPKWIPVTERLPVLNTDDYEELDGSRMQYEVSGDQWVITESGYQTKARYETGVVFQGWVGEFGETVRNVTHWMPLPEPPKDGESQ